MINSKTNCGSGEAIVGYIYNELPSADRLAFEDHLLDCTTCTDEFAAIADSRFAVYEWQKLEFEPMRTPQFAIPYPEPSVSWLNAIKGLFATGPRLATAGALGLLIVTVGLAAIFISTGPTEVVSTSTTPVADTFPVPAAPIVGDTSGNVTAPVESQEAVSPGFTVAKPALKTEQRRKTSNVRRNATRLQNLGNETQAKAPRLNEFDDVADDSLRLSDLVADIDTRD